MRAKTLLSIVALALASMGPLYGSVIEAFCSDTGERGFALSAELACLAIECPADPAPDENCSDEDCCVYDELPAQPFVSPTVPTSLADCVTVASALLPAASPSTGQNQLLHRLRHVGHPRGPGLAAHAGYALPLLI